MSASKDKVPSHVLRVYPFDGEFIASIDYKDDKPSSSSLETVVILDRSGSMGHSVQKIVQRVLPQFFEDLHYDPNIIISLIAFESSTKMHKIKVGDLKQNKMSCAGGTNMSPAVEKLHELFTEFKAKSVNFLRVLTISDGDVFDPNETKELGDKLAEYASTCNISVNSQAVRLFTSCCQPDTTALCSLLQLNNVEKSNLMDVAAQKPDDEMASEMAKLFINDGFASAEFLTSSSSKAIFCKFPWDEGTEKISILQGSNVFWLKELPEGKDELLIDEKPVKIVIESNFTFETIQSLLNAKIAFAIDRIKILKVVSTKNAKRTIEKMVEYFTKIENSLENLQPGVSLDPKNVANRARTLKTNALRSKKFSQFLASLANDESIDNLNTEQKAAYLRNVQVTSQAGRGLAMRAAKKAKKALAEDKPVLDVDEAIRKEAFAIAANFDEISKIDDKKHSVSFYSQATTLEGLRTLVDLTKDGTFGMLDANEILQIVNIVGVACFGPIGDFPDASTWPIKEIYVGCYVSVADIITSFHQAGGDEKLMAPGLDKEITNVIPIFDDPQIGVFLKNYAPSLLEFSSSIGIRRIIADVPMTFGYTIIAGIRRLFYDLNKNKSTVHVETFGKLVETAASFVGKYYDHVEKVLKIPDFCHFGIAELIVPLIRAYKAKNSLNYAAILRSAYAFELRKALTKSCNGKVMETLHKLLSFDAETQKTLPKAPFEAEPEETRTFHDKFTINQEHLDKLMQPLYYHNYMTLLPPFITAAVNNQLEDIKNVPAMSKNTIVAAFGVDCSYNKFAFLNVFQALRYPSKQLKAKAAKKNPKIFDLSQSHEAFDDVKDFVRLQYQGMYEKELKEKKRMERDILAACIVEKITTSTNLTDVLASWREGETRNGVNHKLKNSSSIGFKDLSNKLLDLKAKIPLRAEIIRILLLARDHEGQIVYNNGEICYIDNFKKFKKGFLLTKTAEEWENVEKIMENRGIHKYREKENRHGHGNKHMSFYGFGHTNLLNYLKQLKDFQQFNYCKKHDKCCDTKNFGNFVNPSLRVETISYSQVLKS